MNKEQIVEALERSAMAEQITLPIETWKEVLIQLQQAENKNTCYYQQISELQSENERLKEEVNKSYLVKLFDDENKKLKQQLQEKDEEIEKLKFFKRRYYEMLIEKQTNTHQVCDKIKKELAERFMGWDLIKIHKIINQIEKGDNENDN